MDWLKFGITPLWSDDWVCQLCGHVLDELPKLPDEIAQMVVTSPPYYGLRKYEGNQERIWGGDKNCEHEWKLDNAKTRLHKDWSSGERTISSDSPSANYDHFGKAQQGKFCIKCGAWFGAFGLEPIPEMYVAHSVEILQSIKRVLKKDGIVWWNIADSYWGAKGQSGQGSPEYQEARQDLSLNKPYHQIGGEKLTRPTDGSHPILKPKDLCLIPERLAIALQEDGWWVRSIPIWAKKNTMPESVNGWRWEQHKVKVCRNCGEINSIKKGKCLKCGATKTGRGRGNEDWRAETGQQDHDDNGNFKQDAIWQKCPGCDKCKPNDGLVLRKGSWRPTDAHEYILMLTKSDEYFGDLEAVKEPVLLQSLSRMEYGFSDTEKHKSLRETGMVNNELLTMDSTGKNIRSIWHFATEPYPDAHFATFPEELPKRCILASTSEKGNCSKCGKPWVRIIKSQLVDTEGWGKATKDHNIETQGSQSTIRNQQGRCGTPVAQTLGWKPICDCKAEFEPPIVLDPFSGSGTTGAVAKELGCRAILIDISQKYCSMSKKRVRQAINPTIPMELIV